MKKQLNISTALYIMFFALQSLTTQSQEINFINLGYSSAIKPINTTVNISIHHTPDNTYKLKVKSLSLQKEESGKSIDRELIITKSQYNELVKAVQKIKQSEIITGLYTSVLDGEACTISYGTMGSSISFQVSNPTHNTDKRKLTAFLKAYKLILRIANLESNIILG